MDAAERESLVARYRAGADAVDEALAGITEVELDHRDGDEWSPRMVVHHLADAEANSYLRLRRLLADDEPVLQGYAESVWAERLGYDRRPIDASLAVFRAVRAASSELLDLNEDWDRSGIHTESGPYTLDDWLRIYADHALDHAEQIRRARG
jgi:hypothetical protein